MKNTITTKQMDFINVICKTLDIEFKGKTKKDASNFISQNIKEFNTQQTMDNALNQILYESCGFID